MAAIIRWVSQGSPAFAFLGGLRAVVSQVLVYHADRSTAAAAAPILDGADDGADGTGVSAKKTESSKVMIELGGVVGWGRVGRSGCVANAHSARLTMAARFPTGSG